MLALRSCSLVSVLVVLLGFACSLVMAAYADPGACSGECWTHDPAVVKRSDGTYFRFATGGGIYVYSASALTGPWTYDGEALASGSSIDLSGNDDLWVCFFFFLLFYLFSVVPLGSATATGSVDK